MLGSQADRGGRSRRPRAWAALLLAAVPIALVAGVASGAKLKTRSGAALIPAGTTGEALATCPKGTKLISGGFAGEQDGDSAVFTYAANRRGGKQQGASAVNFGAQAGTLTSFAYCQKKAKLSVRSAQTVIPAGSPTAALGTATATCPKGSTAVSGGFAGPRETDVDIRPYESRRTGKRAWTVSAYSFGSAGGTLTAQVGCQKQAGKLKTASAETSVASEPATGTATATCKKGLRAISGGFLASTQDTDINPYASFKQGGRGWIVSGLNGGPQPGTLTAYAYCRKG